MKKILKVIVFLVIGVFIWNCTFSIIWTSPNSIKYFYQEPENSLDVIYIGSSNSYAHFNTVLAYNLQGFATGMLASDGQPFSAIKYLLQEAIKYQNPEVYVIDINSVATDIRYSNDGDIRKVIDNMKWSENRNDAIEGMLKYTDIKKEDYINYYFSFLTYHNSWKYIGDYSFKNDDLYKGHLLSTDTIKVEPQQEFEWDSEKKLDLMQENLEIYLDLIEYIKANNLNVIFVVPARSFTEENMARLNNAIEIAEENNIKTINFNMLEDFSINYSTDLYNSGHLNVYGATKYTIYFSEYLKNNYNLKDHRQNNNYKSWDKEYERYKDSYYVLTKQNYDDLLEEIYG